jgi:hypothetical protein
VGEGTRTPDIQIHSLRDESSESKSAQADLSSAEKRLARALRKSPKNASKLLSVIDAWPTLPEHVQKMIFDIANAEAQPVA